MSRSDPPVLVTFRLPARDVIQDAQITSGGRVVAVLIGRMSIEGARELAYDILDAADRAEEKHVRTLGVIPETEEPC